jgi:hypothetical protein
MLFFSLVQLSAAAVVTHELLINEAMSHLKAHMAKVREWLAGRAGGKGANKCRAFGRGGPTLLPLPAWLLRAGAAIAK